LSLALGQIPPVLLIHTLLAGKPLGESRRISATRAEVDIVRSIISNRNEWNKRRLRRFFK
jgi:hypothetical protein